MMSVDTDAVTAAEAKKELDEAIDRLIRGVRDPQVISIHMAIVVFSRRYDIGLLGLEQLHPFDTHKHSRAWKRLQANLGPKLRPCTVRPSRPVRREELLAVHSAAYLARLRDASDL